ncbi:MAG: hypothetical protein L3J36_07790 [Rhodobacteraceae bacterium]|nr:hypothetical protein [Paracoccaceae bacterium]
MQALTSILSGPPIWVWPLLALLLLIGLRATRDRQTSLIPIFALPFLGIAGLANLGILPDPALVWPSWGLAYLLMVRPAFISQQKRWLISREGMRVNLRGEWMTFAMVMTIFWANFALGAIAAVAPGILAQPGLQIGVPALQGACAGFFLGRVLGILRA